jgi:hypothetical protein
VLRYKHITVDKIVFIGKEADKIEYNLSGFGKVDYNICNNPKDYQQLLTLKWEEVKNCGISRPQFFRLKKQLKQGKRLHLSSKTLKRLRSIM